MENREFRTLASALRTEPTDKFVLTGTAASYNALSKDLGGFRERLVPGCFTRSLQSPDSDVVFTFNHGMKNDSVFGRTSAGTLQLTDSPQGLNFRCQLDANQQSHRDLHASVKRGDISECSFAFALDGDNGDAFDDAKDEEGRSVIRRTVRCAKLFDVSAVTHPAYGGNSTAVSARSADYVVGRDAPVSTFISTLFPVRKTDNRKIKLTPAQFADLSRRSGVSVAKLQSMELQNELKRLGAEIKKDLRDATRTQEVAIDQLTAEELRRAFEKQMGWS
jgi:hypothetical protein